MDGKKGQPGEKVCVNIYYIFINFIYCYLSYDTSSEQRPRHVLEGGRGGAGGNGRMGMGMERVWDFYVHLKVST